MRIIVETDDMPDATDADIISSVVTELSEVDFPIVKVEVQR